jgi:hypothetical protein
VGNQCVGDAPAPGYTLISLANAPGSPLPATIPSGGVITRWSSNADPEIPPGALSQVLKVLRPTGAPKQFQVVGESSGPISGGLNTFPARIPVQAGDHIGSVSSVIEEPALTFTLYCDTELPGDLVGGFLGNPPVGGTAAVSIEEGGAQIPLFVSVEPDADNDGFGDETQDACPQSAATQGACPTVTVDASNVIKKKGAVIVLVTTSAPAPVSVAGTVKLGKKGKAKLSSDSQTVAPGATTRFKLKFTKKLKKKLKKLPRKKSLRLTLTASATDLVGRVTSDSLKTKLKGQKKPRK